MAGMNLEIGGDASGALGALAATQGAIDSLHGTSVDVNVNVNGAPSAVDSLGRVKEGTEESAKAHDRESDALGRNREAHDRASEGAQQHASANDRLRDSERGKGEETERANDSVGRSAKAHDEAAESVRQHAEEQRKLQSVQASRASGSVQSDSSAVEGTAAAWERALSASQAYSAERTRQASIKSPTEDDKESLRNLGREYTSARNDLQATIGSDDFNKQWVSAQLRGTAPATAAASSVRDDLPAPSYVEKAEAMSSATRRLESAQTQAAATSVAYRKAFDDAFGRAPEGADATGFASNATKSLRDDMQDAQSVFRGASRDVSDMEKAFGTAEQTGMDFGEAMDKVSGPLQMAGMGALVATAGIGLLGTATAALGGGAALESIRETPGLMYQAEMATRDFDKAFRGTMGQEALAAGMPGMKDLQQSLGSLGKVAAQIGVDQLPNVLKDANTLVGDFGHMAMQLEPAMKPAEDAATGFFGALMAGVGQSAPAITSFSNAVAASGPQIQQFTEGAIKGASGIGRLTVDALDALAPAVSGAGNIANNTADFVDDHQSTISSIGSIAAKALPFVSGLIPGAGPLALASTVNQGLSAAADDTSGTSGYPASDWQRGQQMGATWAHTSPKYGTMAGDPAPLGADPASLPQATPEQRALVTGQPTGTSAPSPLQQQQDKQAEQQLQEAPRHTPGSSVSLPPPDQANQLASSLQQVRSSSDNAQQSLQQIGQTTQQSMQQASQSTQTLPQHMQQSLQQMPQQAQQALQPLQQAVQQPMQQMQQAVQQPVQPPDLAQPMQKAVQQVQQAQQPMQDASQDLGSSIPTGAAKGITKDEDEVITIVKHLIEKVITEGATGLDSHSPSQVFAALGESIPQGLAMGIQSQATVATQATSQMINQVTQQARNQLGGAGTAGGGPNDLSPFIPGQSLANSVSGQFGDQIRNQQDIGNRHLDWARDYGQQWKDINRDRDRDQDSIWGDPQRGQDDWRKKQQEDQEKQKDQDDPRKDLDDKERRDGLDRLGYSQATKDRIEKQRAEHDRIAQQKQDERAQLHDSAIYRSRYGDTDPANTPPGMDRQEAQAASIAQNQPDLSWTDRVAQDRAAKNPAEQGAKSVQNQDDPSSSNNMLERLKKTLGIGGEDGGKSVQQGVAKGIKDNQGTPNQAMSDSAGSVQDEAKKKHQSSSPSQVFAGIGGDLMSGMALGIADGTGAVSDSMSSSLAEATAGVQATASNSGLMVGYAYSDNILTGMQTVIKSADFQSSAIPQLSSALATTALGQLGDLGPAAGAGQIPKNLQVALSGGSPAQPAQPTQTTVTNKVTIPGTPLVAMIQTLIEQSFEDYANRLLQN